MNRTTNFAAELHLERGTSDIFFFLVFVFGCLIVTTLRTTKSEGGQNITQTPRMRIQRKMTKGWVILPKSWSGERCWRLVGKQLRFTGGRRLPCGHSQVSDTTMYSLPFHRDASED